MNSYLWNEDTGKRELIEDRAAFLEDLAAKNAEAEAAGDNVLQPAAAEIAVPMPEEALLEQPLAAKPLPPPREDVSLTEVTSPVDLPVDAKGDAPAKAAKPQAEKAAK